MSDIAGRPGFEDAFHKAAERHERAWVFVTLVMLMGILACTMYFVVYDYGVVVRTAAYRSDPTALGGPAPGVVPAAVAGAGHRPPVRPLRSGHSRQAWMLVTMIALAPRS